ncbi:MAG: D-alanine--D-alanine ligase [Eggerthellaceae bacterium]|nr:D-alanine--D-alanine ligase [Eggerthellaceae bacterium]
MSINPQECRVALLSGGTSGEREISIASGKGAKGALEEAGFQVECLDPANKEDLKRLIDEKFDVAFLTLHGKMGEDGTIQGFLELAGIPYTCSGVQASAIAMDKIKSKIMYMTDDIPTAKFKQLVAGQELDYDALVEEIGIPCVVKAAREGSSLGVEIVEDAACLPEAIERVFAVDKLALIESFIKGVEVTCAILGNNDPRALPLIKIVPNLGESYDFESKYAPGGSDHICPAPIDEDLTKKIQAYAIAAHKVLGCRGVSRSDFIIDDDGVPWILETNTIPGMTATSLLPDAASVDGMSFPELCIKLIEFALE